jgi:cystathionine beta-lyase family protein involved in aluminum resistance
MKTPMNLTRILFVSLLIIIMCQICTGVVKSRLPGLKVPPSVVAQASQALIPRFYELDMRTQAKMDEILGLYEREGVDSSAFHGVDGYGYGDLGREKFDNIVASLMGAEQALVRIQIFSGTHAISSALFGVLRPGDKMLAISGAPYDTLEEVIGLRAGTQTGSLTGSLKDWGISYEEIPLLLQHEDEEENGSSSGNGGRMEGSIASAALFDLDAIDAALERDSSVKLIHVQRSCGYQWRPSVPISEIKRLCDHVQAKYKDGQGRDLCIFVDNCYGELVEEQEPCHVGADLVAGSLIKNLGGTIAPCGGYVAGKAKYVTAAQVHLSAPGVEGGATLNQYKQLFQGLFLAPAVVAESIKGAELIAEVMQNQLGFPCNPPPGAKRTDIIQAVRLGSRERLISFCETVQKKSPVGAHIRPVPGVTSGYGDEVIFADGTFVEGSTLELSADGPLREPFVAFTQGCTHWTHWSLVLQKALKTWEGE